MGNLSLGILALASCVIVFAVPTALADVKLPSIFGDNMVLQRDQKVPVWGTAAPGEKVTVKFGEQSKTSAADVSGKWRVTLDPLEAGGPFEMTVAASSTVTFKNVLVGEVWLASGQSNMQMSLRQVNDAEKEIASSNFPKIRLCSVAHTGAATPQSDLYAEWVECTPKTSPPFSAAAYFFARKLHTDMNVPVGIIHDSWSGSLCETWVSKESLEALPEIAPNLDAWKNAIANRGDKEKAAEADYRARFAAWQKEYASAEPGVRPEAPWPDNPFDPVTNFQRPSGNYSGMIAPLIPYAIKGVIWYQGEGNSERAVQYRRLFPALIADWRKLWGQGDFPFIFVQISSLREAPSEPSESEWAELREAQVMTLKAPNTGMAMSLDCGEVKDPHFKNKKDVGIRLALVAEGMVYGMKVAYQAPLYDSMKIEPGKIRLKFANVVGGLVAKASDDLRTFQIAGKDQRWVWADARIDDDSVVVSSDKVAKPVAVRYGWMDNALAANLYNKAGLPASSFRTDDWRVSTEGVLVWPGIERHKK